MESMIVSEIIGSSEVKPFNDGFHRRLGITLEGMYFFLEEIGFIEWEYPDLWLSIWAERRKIPPRAQRSGYQYFTNDRYCKCKECDKLIDNKEKVCRSLNEIAKLANACEGNSGSIDDNPYLERYHVTCFSSKMRKERIRHSHGWRYKEQYKRGETLSWVSGPLPTLDTTNGFLKSSPGIINMTGYDMKAFIVDWLKKENLSEYSIAEIILTNPRFAHLRDHVGIATIFWSHVQSEPIIDQGKGTLLRIIEAREKYASQLPEREQQFWWLDYFSLRQGIDNDFDLPAIIELIRGMKIMICSLQDGNNSIETYMRRIFCLFEMSKAIDCKVTLICYGPRYKRGQLEVQLAPDCPEGLQRWLGPINTALATTSDPKEKQKIDEYIRSTVGFSEVDKIVTRTLLENAACDVHDIYNCGECPVTFYSDPCTPHSTSYCFECLYRFDFLNAVRCKLHRRHCCSLCYNNTGVYDISYAAGLEFIIMRCSYTDLRNLSLVPKDHLRFCISTEPEIVDALAKGFPNLTALDLHSRILHAEDVETILQSFPSLEYLNLRSGRIFSHGPSSRRVTGISGGKGSIEGDDGDDSNQSAVVFIRALEYGRNLRYLNLQDNQLRSTTAALVLQELSRCCPDLECLVLDDQELLSTGHRALIAGLAGLSALKELSLVNTHLENELVPMLCSQLAHLSHLKQLNVSGNLLSPDSLLMLQEAVDLSQCEVIS